LGNLGPALSLESDLLNLALAQGDQGDFGSNKEAAEGDKKGNDAQVAEK
jgi:hypothetical protein